MARVDEKPAIATWAMTSSAVIALAWLYVSTYILKLGIPGERFITPSPESGACLFFTLFSARIPCLRSAKDLHFDKNLIMEIMKIGFPFLLVQASSTVFGIVINNFLGAYGTPMRNLAAYAV
ncbi:MAG: hypothetical protein ACLTW9_03825 [Enterocloster sp.]